MISPTIMEMPSELLRFLAMMATTFYFITIASIEIVPEPSILILLGTAAMGLLVCIVNENH